VANARLGSELWFWGNLVQFTRAQNPIIYWTMVALAGGWFALSFYVGCVLAFDALAIVAGN
jgi:hypothetical protein